MWEIKNHLKNNKGTLYIEECNAIELTKEYDTPLYVYSESRIKENYLRLFNAFKKNYDKFKLYYSLKANDNLAISRILQKLGAGADCSSPAEIHLAKKAGITDIIYSGIYYRDDEIAYGVKNKVKINLDNADKLDALAKTGTREVCFRINPGIGNGKFDQIVTGGKEAKFGIVEEDILNAYKKAKELGFNRFGIHMMTGSCIIEGDYFEKITTILMDMVGNIANQLKIKFDFIDIGGGFGIPYENNEKELDIEEVAKSVTKVFKKKLEEYNLGNPYLVIEPGRYIVGDAAILLTKVASIKKNPKNFIGVDASMSTLIRPMLYNTHHEIYLANDLNSVKENKVDIVGQICETTDVFAKNTEMPKIKENDILAILNAGAYGFSMSSTYGGKPKPAEVLVNGNKHELIRKRQTFEDLEKNQIIPERLR